MSTRIDGEAALLAVRARAARDPEFAYRLRASPSSALREVPEIPPEDRAAVVSALRNPAPSARPARAAPCGCQLGPTFETLRKIQAASPSARMESPNLGRQLPKYDGANHHRKNWKDPCFKDLHLVEDLEKQIKDLHLDQKDDNDFPNKGQKGGDPKITQLKLLQAKLAQARGKYCTCVNKSSPGACTDLLMLAGSFSSIELISKKVPALNVFFNPPAGVTILLQRAWHQSWAISIPEMWFNGALQLVAPNAPDWAVRIEVADHGENPKLIAGSFDPAGPSIDMSGPVHVAIPGIPPGSNGFIHLDTVNIFTTYVPIAQYSGLAQLGADICFVQLKGALTMTDGPVFDALKGESPPVTMQLSLFPSPFLFL